MENESRVVEVNVLALALPFQGHINPMLQFSKRLVSKGVKVTLITFANKPLTGEHGPVTFEFFPTDSNIEEDDGFKNLQATMRRKLPKIVAKHCDAGFPASCLIYDSLMPWVLDIARQLGLRGASFFTQCTAVNYVYQQVHEGNLNVPVCVEGIASLEICDLPTFCFQSEKYPTSLTLMANQFLNVADWMFCNTFNSLEDELLSRMARKFPIKSIGPTIPSKYVDKKMKDNNDYGISLFNPNVTTCMKWLDNRTPSSVVYISFGSITDLEEKQMKELAIGLKRSNQYFLWVIKESEEKKLPINFIGETLEKGMIVNWCPQLEVLAHRSVGCFVTHCGWNSILEALSSGVPMVAMPQWGDQTTNAKFVADVWGVGVRVKVDEEEIGTKEEIELRIREVMEGDEAIKMRNNSQKWKILSKQAIDEGGSSDKNIEEFVANLISVCIGRLDSVRQ